MKITIDIPEALLRGANKLAAREGVSLETLIARGLHLLVAEAKQKLPPFELRRASFGGKGLSPDLLNCPWEAVLDRAYEGRDS